jgi:hypothetical protein
MVKQRAEMRSVRRGFPLTSRRATCSARHGGATRRGTPLIGLALCLLAWALAACAGTTPGQGPPEIKTSDDLVAALKDAGAEVQAPSSVDGPILEVPARSISVDGSDVLVYEYATEEARQTVSSTISNDATTIGGRPAVWTSPAKVWVSGQLIVVYSGRDGGTILLLSSLLGDPLGSIASEVNEPYPPAIASAIKTVAAKLGVDPASVEVKDFESIDWSDACLGLPTAGELCAEAVTPGWRIVLIAGGTQVEAHTDLLGSQVRLK